MEAGIPGLPVVPPPRFSPGLKIKQLVANFIYEPVNRKAQL